MSFFLLRISAAQLRFPEWSSVSDPFWPFYRPVLLHLQIYDSADNPSKLSMNRLA